MEKLKFKKYLIMFLLCTFLGCTASYLFSRGFYEELNIYFLTQCFSFRQKYFSKTKNIPSDDIVVVIFDDESNKKLNMFWPYNRSEIAKVISFLQWTGAKAVLFDILFSYPKTTTEAEKLSDKKLIDAVKNAKMVYLGSKFLTSDKTLGLETEKNKFLKDFSIDINVISKKISFSNLLPESKSIIHDLPMPDLLKVTKNIGFFNVPSQNEVVTKGNLFKCDHKFCYPSLPFACFLDSQNTHKINLEPGKSVIVNDVRIPVDKKSYITINWLGSWLNRESEEKKYGKPFIYKTLPAFKLIKSYNNIINILDKYQKSPEEIIKIYSEKSNKELYDELSIINPQTFKDKYVVIGVSSSGAQDFISTPFDRMPGVFKHAFILDSLLTNNFIHFNANWINLIILIVLSIITSLSVIYGGYKDKLIIFSLPLIYSIGYIYLCYCIFGLWNYYIDIATPFLGIEITLIISMFYYFVLEGKDKLQIKRAMSNYISPQVMKYVMEDPELLKPTAIKRKEVSIFFFDIRSFTTISESCPPELVAKLLNEYHNEIITIIFNNKGTLDKIIGDAVMAFWNAPIDVEDHPYLAVKSALEVKEKLEDLNKVWAKVVDHPVNFGIGINTEEVVVGNIGSDKFMDYTVIGDGVNLAARLEGLNKNYGTNILISEFTYRKLRDRINIRYLDKVKVKGKTEETNVYELLNLTDGGYSG